VVGKFAQFFTRPRPRKRAEQVAEQITAALQVTGPPPQDQPFALLVTTHPGTRKDGKPRAMPGDADNLAKLVADALEGILYANDRQGVFIGGIQGEQVDGEGAQTVDIVYLDPESALPAATSAAEALLCAFKAYGVSNGG
jgi:Holliday junction resolvase RusA-like endonuclease